jgi:hypothetical protein
MIGARGLGGKKGRADVKAEPPGGQEQAADDDIDQIMTGNGTRTAIAGVFAQARPEGGGAHQSDHPAGRVNNGGTGEIHKAVAQAEVLPQLRQPSAAPHPVAKDGQRQRRRQHSVKDILPISSVRP